MGLALRVSTPIFNSRRADMPPFLLSHNMLLLAEAMSSRSSGSTGAARNILPETESITAPASHSWEESSSALSTKALSPQESW